MAKPYMEILVLLSLTKVHSERCPLGGFDEMQVFPPPPEFPDFMAAFEGSILRMGLTNLLQNDGLTLSKTCPGSVNWSEFNSRLCGPDPFDLEGFCNPTTTAELTVASLTTPQIAEVRSISVETTTEHLVGTPPNDLGINTTPTTAIRATNLSPSFSHHDETDPMTPGISQSPDHKGNDSENHEFNDSGSKDPESEDHSHKNLGPEYPVLPPDPYPVNGTTVVEALYQGDGASIAIGIGCGLTLLCIVIIVVIIIVSHTRGRGCRRLMNPLFKVFQRQTSDALPFTWSSPNQPSTPLEEIRANGGILTDNGEGQLRWTEERRSTEFVTTEAQDNLLTDFHQSKLEAGDDGRTSAISSTSKTFKNKGQGETMVNGDAIISGDARDMVESKKGGLEEVGSRNGKNLENSVPLRDTMQAVAWESWVNQLFDKLK